MKNRRLLFFICTISLFIFYNAAVFGQNQDFDRCFLDCTEYVDCYDCELPEKCIYGSNEWNACLKAFCNAYLPQNGPLDLCKQLSAVELEQIRNYYYSYYYATGETPSIKFDTKTNTVNVDSLFGPNYEYNIDWNLGVGHSFESSEETIHEYVSSQKLKSFFDKNIPNLTSIDSAVNENINFLSGFGIMSENTILYSDPMSGKDGIFKLNEEEYVKYLLAKGSLQTDISRRHEISMPREIRNFLLYSTPVHDLIYTHQFVGEEGGPYLKDLSSETITLLDEIIFSDYTSYMPYYLELMTDLGIDHHDIGRLSDEYYSDEGTAILESSPYLFREAFVLPIQDDYPYINQLPTKEQFLAISYERIYLDGIIREGLYDKQVSFQEYTEKEYIDQYNGTHYTEENTKQSNLNYIRQADRYLDALSTYDESISSEEKEVLEYIENNLNFYLESYAFLATYTYVADSYSYNKNGENINIARSDLSNMLLPFEDFVAEQYSIYSLSLADEDNTDIMSLESFAERYFPGFEKVRASKVDFLPSHHD